MTKKSTTKSTSEMDATARLIARAGAGGDEELIEKALQGMSDQAETWTNNGAVTPRYVDRSLLGMVERSSILPQCLDAMAVGIDGWGHRFEPVIKISDDDVEDQVKAAIILEREADAREIAQAKGDEDWTVDYEIDDSEVKERLEILTRQLPIQKFRAETWFISAPSGAPFVELRQWMRNDQYSIGRGVLEIARDEIDYPVQIGYIPAHTLLPLAKKPPPTKIKTEVPVSPISKRKVNREVQFDIYVQQVGNKRKYFKEFGDPRVVSQHTGKVYKTIKAMEKAENKKKGSPKSIPATEVLYLPVHSPNSTAGEPPWVGQIPNVLGVRAAEEVNFDYFDNKAIPPGAWIVIGGMLDDPVRKLMEDHIRKKVKGRSNFHTPLIIELAAPQGARDQKVEQPKISWMSFRGDLDKDATHLKYDEASRDKVRGSFRLPRILTGDVQDALARANAYASVEFANTHVFSPPRTVFDWIINERLMPALGITLWKFVSNSPDTTDIEQVAKTTDVFANRGGITPADVRKIAADALNMELDPIDEPWSNVPLALTLAGFAAEQMGVPADGVGADILGSFGPDGTPEKRALAQKILTEFFVRFGYELKSITSLSDE